MLRGIYTFLILGQPAAAPEDRPRAGYSEVSAALFDTLKIPLLKGRYLDEHDTETAPWAIVINETMAQKYFPNANPIGQQIVLRFDPYPVEESRPRQIVGVVGDVKQYGLGDRPRPSFTDRTYNIRKCCQEAQPELTCITHWYCAPLLDG